MATEFRHLPSAISHWEEVERQANRAATLAVCSLATDAIDAAFLLDVLGLDPRELRVDGNSPDDERSSQKRRNEKVEDDHP